MKRGSDSLAATCAALALSLLALPARSLAAGVDAAVTPLFSISKTENRNYVQFAERLDEACAPVGPAPIYAFWRMMRLAKAREHFKAQGKR